MRQWLLALSLVACDASAMPDAGRDAPAPDAGMPVDPARFDCRAPAPLRASPLAVDCPVDPACTERMMSAHRGAGAPGVLAPENSLSAIRAAIVLGADLVEMDVRFTADDVAVLMHDGEVDRTTSGNGGVGTLTLTELQALTLETDDLSGDFSCDHVPTLDEALALTDGRIITVLDMSKTDRIEDIVAVVADAGALDRVVFDEADLAVLDRVIAAAPAAHVLLRATDAEEATAGLTHLSAHPPVYIHIDLSPPGPIAAVAGSQRLFALGFTADVLVRSDPDAYASIYESGVTMIQSNRPDLLGAYLAR